MSRGRAVARAFGAANDYDRHAGVQRSAAEQLAERIAVLAIVERPRAIDIGSGTGFLAAALMPRLAGARWVISDLAPEMVSRARGRLPGSHGFVAMDALRPCFLPASFDLVCSNLTAQWFDDLAGGIAAMAELVAPGGLLAFSTLVRGSLAEWSAAHQALGLEAGTPAFPTTAALDKLIPKGMNGKIAVERILHRHKEAADLLQTLRGIGATVPKSDRAPLRAGAMRAVMRQFEAMGAAISYEIAYCLFRKGDR